MPKSVRSSPLALSPAFPKILARSLTSLSPKSANGNARFPLRCLRPLAGRGESEAATGVSRRGSRVGGASGPAGPAAFSALETCGEGGGKQVSSLLLSFSQ